MIPIFFQFIHMHREVCLRCPLFPAFHSLLGSVRAQEKATKRHKVNWLEEGCLGAASHSLTCVEERRWCGVQEPLPALGSHSIRRHREGTLAHTIGHHLDHTCLGFNAQDRTGITAQFDRLAHSWEGGTVEGELAWKAGDLGSRAATGSTCGTWAGSCPAKPQVHLWN
jgi:hypothetical protein